MTPTSLIEIVLSGEALVGVGPHPVGADAFGPATVRLGCKPPRPRKPPLRLGTYFDPARMAAAPPVSTNRRAKAAASLARMYLNDQYGDCVIAGKAHALGLWSANDAAAVVLATDSEIYDQYQSICGPGDNGCYITDVLDVMKAKGFKAGGKLYKIDGYVAVDWRNKLAVQVAQYVFGATTIGIDLPQAWTSAAVWDVTNTPIVGGHDVTPIDYDDQGVYVSSWGRVYLMTWAAFTSTRWVSEYYALLAPLWYGDDKLAPNGIDVAALKSDLTALGNGQVPDVGPPVTTTTTPRPDPGTTTTTPAPGASARYSAAQGATLPALIQEVNRLKALGWVEQGGVALAPAGSGTFLFAQALTRNPA